MARTTQKVSTQLRGEFIVFNASDAPVTGLGDSDFTKLLSKDGADQSTTGLTITEVGNGRYTYTYTPASVGYWVVRIANATYKPRGWVDEYDVTADGQGVFTKMIDGFTVEQIFMILAAYAGGKSSGGQLDDAIRSINDAKTRITAVMDANGHRTSVTLNVTP